MDASSFPLLTTLIVLPAVGALVVGLLPNRRPEYVRPVGLLFAVATGALSVYALVAFKAGEGFAFTSHHVWIRQWGISWSLGLDGISLFLVVLTGVLFPLSMLGSSAHHDEKPYTAWILLLEAGVLGSFLALDLFLFFVFFEIVLVPMYFLIGGWGYANRVYAALKFFLYTMAGSALMLVGIVTLAFLHRNAVEDQDRAEAQQIIEQTQGNPNPGQEQRIAELQAGKPLSFDLVEIAENHTVVDDSKSAS